MALWPKILTPSLASPFTRGLACALAFGSQLAVADPAAAQTITTAASPSPSSPDGGSRIVNQATVAYEDATGRERFVTTNEVVLVVQSVYAGQISVDQSKVAAPGTEARFVHTLVNTGNVAANFCVSGALFQNLGATLVGGVRVYLDLNRDSMLDSGDLLLHDSAAGAPYGLTHLARDEQASLILAVEVGALSAASSLVATLQAQIAPASGSVCAAGLVTGDVAYAHDRVEDRLQIEAAAALDLVKSSGYMPGGPGVADDQILYVLTLTNKGSAAAQEVVLIDEIKWPMTYVPGSLSLTPSVAGTLNAGRKGFSFALTAPLAAGASVEAIFLVAPNLQGPPPHDAPFSSADPFAYPSSFAYSAGPNEPALAAPYDPLTNAARVQWRNALGNPAARRQVFSNKTRDHVLTHRNLSLEDTGVGANAALNDGGDDDALLNDVQSVAQIGEGGTVRFDLNARNLSDSAERLQLSVAPGSFPTGSVFMLHHPDGATRLTDSDGDGWFDVGLVGAGAAVKAVIRVSLPMGVPTAGPYEAEATLRLLAERDRTDPATLRLGTISPARLDVAATAGPAFNDGGAANQDPVSAAAATLTGGPGQSLSQTLLLANEGGADEDAVLRVWLDAAMTTPAPEAWGIFLTASTADPTQIAHVGPLAPAGTTSFVLNLRVPPDATPGTHSFYVSAQGAASGAADALRVDVIATAVAVGLLLSPDRSASAALCGEAVYVHRLAHHGSSALTARLRLLSQSAFSSTTEWPSGAAGAEPSRYAPLPQHAPGATIPVFEAATASWILRALVSDGAGGTALPLSPGDWTNVRLRVFTPCAAAEGARDVAILAAESLDGLQSSFVRDVTTASRVAFSIEKAGAPDATCDGVPDSAFVTGGVFAPPRACVIWRLTASNLGVEPVCDVRVADVAPEFTVLQGSPYIVSQPSPGGGSCAIVGSTIACLVGPPLDIDGDGSPESHCLRPGESAEARFSVRIE